jgi:replication initiator protein A
LGINSLSATERELRASPRHPDRHQPPANIITGGKDVWDVFSLVDRARIVRESRDGRMQEVEIVLSDWVFQAVEAQEVLTLDRRYFQLAKPLERRLYELARKHIGQQENFKIGLEKLRNKCGSQSTLKEFRRLLQSIITDDVQHNHMPGYSFHLDGDMVEMRRKTAEPSPAEFVIPDQAAYLRGSACPRPGLGCVRHRGRLARLDQQKINHALACGPAFPSVL